MIRKIKKQLNRMLWVIKYGVDLKILKKQNKLKKYNVIEIIMLKNQKNKIDN